MTQSVGYVFCVEPQVQSVGMSAWYLYGVKLGHHHPGTFGVNVILTAGMFWFLVGYAFVDKWMSCFALVKRNPDTGENNLS